MKFRNLIFILFVMFFWLQPVFAKSEISCGMSLEGKNNAQLSSALKKCEEEIAVQESLLKNKQRESISIEAGIDSLKYKIRKTLSDIRVKEIKIYQLSKDIGSKKKTLIELGEKNKRILSLMKSLIRKTNELDSFSAVEAILSKKSLSEFFIDFNNFDVLKGDLQTSLAVINNVKKETEVAKNNLEESQRRERAIKIAKEQERRKNELYKKENEKLLSLSKAQEKEYKKTIAEKERIKNEIRNRMFRTVGGTEMRFEDALKLIQPYEGRIGVETALVLAVLTQESAVDGVIGSNLGHCTYNQPAKNKSGTVMSNSQKDSFLAIMKELGMNPDTTPVSCPIYADGAYGGAIGPSQFMPKTWWNADTGYGYKKRVAKILGIVTPSPFRNLDAFVGTASYLSDARERCSGPKGFSKRFDIWRCSAAKYYAGLGARGSKLLRHMTSKWSYGYKVAERAEAFQKDIDTLGL